LHPGGEVCYPQWPYYTNYTKVEALSEAVARQSLRPSVCLLHALVKNMCVLELWLGVVGFRGLTRISPKNFHLTSILPLF